MVAMSKAAKQKREGYLNLMIDPEVKNRIQEFADEEDRSLSNYVNRLLKQHIADKSARTEGAEGREANAA